jgi:hypothetical protein
MSEDIQPMLGAVDVTSVDIKKDGVIDYPLFDGMQLHGVWVVNSNPSGPGVAPADGFLHYSVTNMQGYNQWAQVSITTLLPGQGSISTFRVRANVIQGSEVKFSIADGIILRFTSNGSTVRWQCVGRTDSRPLPPASSGRTVPGTR